MSVVKNSKYGWFISHELLIKEIYSNTGDSRTSFQLKPELFNIITPYKTSKNKSRQGGDKIHSDFKNEVRHVEDLYKLFYSEISDAFAEPNFEVMNKDAITAANTVYEKSGRNSTFDLYGANPGGPIVKTLGDWKFLFPRNSKFYGKDVTELSKNIQSEKYDLILLDPPWWNKYIRRKRKRSEQGYDMMYNEELKSIPLENHISNNSLVVVWCTNSNQHADVLRNEIFAKWNLTYLGKWYWVKVTKSGTPVCPFSHPPRKQPFEQIIIACGRGRTLTNPPCDKLVVSVPSALHSHKPPLVRLLEPYLPESPKCLELFARYLLPDWTSYGKEVLRLQHECLYTEARE